MRIWHKRRIRIVPLYSREEQTLQPQGHPLSGLGLPRRTSVTGSTLRPKGALQALELGVMSREHQGAALSPTRSPSSLGSQPGSQRLRKTGEEAAAPGARSPGPDWGPSRGLWHPQEAGEQMQQPRVHLEARLRLILLPALLSASPPHLRFTFVKIPAQ